MNLNSNFLNDVFLTATYSERLRARRVLTRCPEVLIPCVEFTQPQAKNRPMEYRLFICTDSTTPTTEPSDQTNDE